MDQNENTKSGPEPEQVQSPGPQDSANQAEEPGNMKAESPRKCEICGGPNHYGCGCEAKQLREAKEAGLTENEAKTLLEPEPQPAAVHVETENLQQEVKGLGNDLEKLAGYPESEAPASETQTPIDKMYEALEDFLSPEVIIEAHKSNMQMAKDIKTMADGFEGLCACFYDTNNYLKLIAGDMITIRKLLTEEDDPKLIESDVKGTINHYLSNIEQQLREINERGQNAG